MSTLQTTNLKHPDSAGNQVTFTAGGDINFDSGAVFIDSSNNHVGIGTTAPSQLLHLESAAPRMRLIDSDVSTGGQISGSNGNLSLTYDISGVGGKNFSIADSTSTKLTVDSSGRLLVGTTSASSGRCAVFQGHSGAASGQAIVSFGCDSTAPGTGGTISSLRFCDGNKNDGAMIDVIRDGGTWTSGSSHPSAFSFKVAADGASSPTERMVIDKNGAVTVKRGSTHTTGLQHGLAIQQSSGTNGNRAGLVFKSLDGYSIAGVNGVINTHSGTQNNTVGCLEFYTKPSGVAAPVERMSINADGDVRVGQATTSSPGDNNNTQGFCFRVANGTGANVGRFYASAGADHNFNRTSDGVILAFRSAGVNEGAVSISGTTVTYGGGHLARWSQLLGNGDPSEILKGTVMSNLDEMCEWHYEAQDAVLYTEEDELPEGVSVGDVKIPAKDVGTEDNEQLNRTKISDIEGDPSVAGVFVSTSFNDEGPFDFYVGMTGDMVIRISQGTTVARGDLLMSAGDGTAKPQDDDIIRSKTIAKVTSANVSETYADGSYCVPCVLMAC